VADLPMTATAAAFKGEGGGAAIVLTVQAPPGALRFVEKDGLFVNEIELTAVAVDAKGKTAPSEAKILKLTLKPDTYQRVQKSGLRFITTLTAAPGRHQIRVAMRESQDQRVGTVHYDLEAPDFNKASFAMSCVLLSAVSAYGVQTYPVSTIEVMKPLPGPPTVARVFRRGDEISALVEVYDNRPQTPHKVDITATVKSDEGRELFRHQEERASQELGGSRGGYGYTARIPLTDYAPGLYVLRIEAKSRLAEQPAAVREIAFRVQS
jgi:hypothetical protein